jgi:hypothetical protein
MALLLGVVLSLAGASSLPARVSAAEPVDLLVVNESPVPDVANQITLLSVPLRQLGLFGRIDVSAVSVKSSLVDPLGPNTGGQQYDLIIVVPQGLGISNLTQIWIVSCAITPSTRPEVIRAIQAIQNIVQGGTKGTVQAVGVLNDFVLAFFSAVFQKDGWLRC